MVLPLKTKSDNTGKELTEQILRNPVQHFGPLLKPSRFLDNRMFISPIETIDAINYHIDDNGSKLHSLTNKQTNQILKPQEYIKNLNDNNNYGHIGGVGIDKFRSDKVGSELGTWYGNGLYLGKTDKWLNQYSDLLSTKIEDRNLPKYNSVKDLFKESVIPVADKSVYDVKLGDGNLISRNELIQENLESINSPLKNTKNGRVIAGMTTPEMKKYTDYAQIHNTIGDHPGFRSVNLSNEKIAYLPLKLNKTPDDVIFNQKLIDDDIAFQNKLHNLPTEEGVSGVAYNHAGSLDSHVVTNPEKASIINEYNLNRSYKDKIISLPKNENKLGHLLLSKGDNVINFGRGLKQVTKNLASNINLSELAMNLGLNINDSMQNFDSDLGTDNTVNPNKRQEGQIPPLDLISLLTTKFFPDKMPSDKQLMENPGSFFDIQTNDIPVRKAIDAMSNNTQLKAALNMLGAGTIPFLDEGRRLLNTINSNTADDRTREKNRQHKNNEIEQKTINPKQLQDNTNVSATNNPDLLYRNRKQQLPSLPLQLNNSRLDLSGMNK